MYLRPRARRPAACVTGRGFRHTERSHDRFEAEPLAHFRHFNRDRRCAGNAAVEKTGRIVRLPG